MTEASLELSAGTRRLLLQRGLRLEYATLGWNVLGSVLALDAAAAARSVALAGFGLDSLIEIVASAVVVWQLKDTDKHREHKALRLIGIAFILLALYIGAQSTYVLAADSGRTTHSSASPGSRSPRSQCSRSPVAGIAGTEPQPRANPSGSPPWS